MAKLAIGTKISESGVGAGKVTGFSERGFPQVNGITVGWCKLECGALFDPYDVADKARKSSEPGGT